MTFTHQYMQVITPTRIVNPIKLQASLVVNDDQTVSETHIRSSLTYKLIDLLGPYLHIERDINLQNLTHMFNATITLLPLDTKQCAVDDQYTVQRQHFTQAEIDAAILHTYPERFV